MKTSGETGVSLGRSMLALVVVVVLALAGFHVGFDAGHGRHQEAERTSQETRSTQMTRTVGRASVSPDPVRVKGPAPSRVTRTGVRTRAVTGPTKGNAITVNYGAYAGQVRILEARWHPLDPVARSSHLDVQARYTGRAGCRVAKLFGIAATLFDSSGKIAATSGTGASNLVQGVSFPLTIRFFTKVERGRIGLRVTDLRC